MNPPSPEDLSPILQIIGWAFLIVGALGGITHVLSIALLNRDADDDPVYEEQAESMKQRHIKFVVSYAVMAVGGAAMLQFLAA